MPDGIGIIAALVAGLASFVSPCVLPLVPAYISFLSGLTAAQIAEDQRAWRHTLVPALLFVAGFSAVFIAFGASASVIGQLLLPYRAALGRIAGVIVIAFGLLLLGVVRVPWLYAEARLDMARARSFGRGAALVMGMAFAAAWTPCVGPILGSILALAGSSGDVGTGVALLFAYSVGLGIPFLVVAVLLARITPLLQRIARHSGAIERVAGVVLIVIGVLMVAGRLGAIAVWLSRLVPALGV